MMARSTVALKAANWRSRRIAARSPRSVCRAPRWTSLVWSSRSIGPLVLPAVAVRRPTRAIVAGSSSGGQPRPSDPSTLHRCVTGLRDWCLTRLAKGWTAEDACYPPGQPVRPRQATNRTLSTGSAPQQRLREIRRSVGFAVPRGRPARTQAPPEEQRGLRRSNPNLRRLRFRVHTLGRGSGVLRPEGLRLGSEALPQLSRGPAQHARSRGERRSQSTRQPEGVLRRRLFSMRQPGPGAFPSEHGSAGLLLGLLPHRSRGKGRLASASCPDGQKKTAAAFRRPPFDLREGQTTDLLTTKS